MKEADRRIEERIVRWVGGFVILGGMSWGMDLGAVSGALPSIQSRFRMSKVEIGSFVSLASPGEVLGAFVAGIISDRYGRRKCLALCDISFCASALCLATAMSKHQLYIGRFSAGFAAGSAVVAQVLYASEIAPARRRGRATACFEVAISIGYTLSFLVFFASENTKDDQRSKKQSWRLLFLLPSVPAFCQLILLHCCAPESPAWLDGIGRRSEARRVDTLIQRKFGGGDLSRSTPSGGPAVPVQKKWCQEVWDWRWPLALVWSCSFLTFVGGGFNLRIYAVSILEKAGWSERGASSGILGLGVIKLCATIFALCKIDSVGRRPFLLFSLLSSAVAALATALWLYIKTSQLKKILVLAALLMYTASFQLGFGVCNFILVGELFPSHTKGRLAALIKAPTAALASITQILFEFTLGQRSHLILLFFGHSLVNICGFFFFRLAFVETKQLDATTIRDRLAATPFAHLLSSKAPGNHLPLRDAVVPTTIPTRLNSQDDDDLSNQSQDHPHLPGQVSLENGSASYFNKVVDARGRHRRVLSTSSSDEEDDNDKEVSPPDDGDLELAVVDYHSPPAAVLLERHQEERALV